MNSCIDIYPYLESLVGGWFHQDFDLAGESLDEILADYKSSAPREDLGGVRADIHRFLRHSSADLDADFAARFNPGVLPSQWGLSVRDWLLHIDRALA